MYSVEHLALSACLAICLCRCVSNDVEYLLSRSCSGFKMFRNSFSLAGGGNKKVLRQNPRIRRHTFPGTSRQLIYLSEEEMKAVEHSELPLGMCFFVCIKDRKCVGILYPCVYVKLLQMLRVSAVLLLVSSTQGLWVQLLMSDFRMRRVSF